MAKRFLSEHAMMTVSDYARLVGLSRTTASKELRKWLETNRKDIGTKGKGSHRIYVKAPGAEGKQA